jgi:hypothetical protein
LPFPLNRNMGKATAPPFAVYRAEQCELLLSAIGYQLFRSGEQIYWPAASTRSYSQESMTCPHVTIDGGVVIVQDSFEGSNFSHFLFDWIPRIGHFLSSGLADPISLTFIMGGIPAEFHFRVVQAVCEIYGVKEKQFVFPREPEIWHINGPIYFFSDLKDANMHPAHMAHSRSIAIIREVCSRIATPSGTIKRVYISRGDTALRRIANEVEVFDALRPLGFVEVQLAALPWLEQVALFRGADVIVAPHGMGLTHLAFHEGRPLIVELHNPAIGTDTYAFPAQALGFGYRAVLGTDLGGFTNHFTIAAQVVVKVLSEEGITAEPAADYNPLSGIRTKFLGGVQSVSASEIFHISPLQPNDHVYMHVHDDVMTQPDNNSGWLEVSGLINGTICHCSCDVWFPSHFRGERVTLTSSALSAATIRAADPRKTDQWQTISIGGTANEPLINFVLRCDGDAGCGFYSSGWRFGLGTGLD